MRNAILTFMIITVIVFFNLPTADAATLKGVISAKAGAAPAKVNITKDQAVCGKNPLYKESLMVSSSGGLKNAVVEIVGAGKTEPGTATIIQKGCNFTPHVLTVTAESVLVVKNEDGISHNFHTFGFENDPVNFSQPGTMKVKKVDEGFEEPEVIKVQCDIHEWMNAWIVVTAGSAVGVTGADGAFSIRNVKPGKYKVKVWHEKLGEVEKDVTVKEGDNSFNLKMVK